MSIFKRLQAVPNAAGPDSSKETSTSDTEISEQREADIRKFFEYLKRKEHINNRMQELSQTRYEYYCKSCDMPFKTIQEVQAHEQTQEHLQKEDAFKHSQYNCRAYDKLRRRRARREALQTDKKRDTPAGAGNKAACPEVKR